MSKVVKNYLVTIVGLIILGTGLAMIKLISDPQGVLLALPYICIGIGCGLFGHGMGNIISERVVRKDPKLKKQMEIEEKDERNIAITCHAKAKAYDMMTFVYGALMISFPLMGVDMVVVLLLVASYLFVQGCGIYYRVKYDKEM